MTNRTDGLDAAGEIGELCRTCLEPATHLGRYPTTDGKGMSWPVCDDHYPVALVAGWKPDALASPSPSSQEDVDACSVCLVAFKPDDVCSTDIELGICHAECLKGSPTVDLETGDPVDGEIPTYRYDDDMLPATDASQRTAYDTIGKAKP